MYKITLTLEQNIWQPSYVWRKHSNNETKINIFLHHKHYAFGKVLNIFSCFSNKLEFFASFDKTGERNFFFVK